MTKATRMAGATVATLAMALAATAAPPALAQGYLGGGIGPSRINIDCSDFTSCDKTDVGGKLYGGFKFMPNLGVELTYFNWGKAKGSGTIDVTGEAGPTTITGSGEVKGDGVGVGLAYIVPFSPDWNGVARVGVARNKGKTTVASGGASSSETFHSTEAYIGFGAGYNVSPMLTVTGEFDFSRLKYASDQKASVNLFTLGLRYSF